MHPLTQTVGQLFIQTENALLLISDEQYSFKNPLMSHASVGQHVRHVIELFQEMMAGYTSGEINYEMRRRDFLIENDKNFAIQQMQALLAAIEKPDKPLILASTYTEDDNCIKAATNFFRELIYNIEHTVHHLALIKIAFKSAFDIDLPNEFGVATSTLKYRKACAQ